MVATPFTYKRLSKEEQAYERLYRASLLEGKGIEQAFLLAVRLLEPLIPVVESALGKMARPLTDSQKARIHELEKARDKALAALNNMELEQ